MPSEEIERDLTALKITKTTIKTLPRNAFRNKSIEILSLDRNTISHIDRCKDMEKLKDNDNPYSFVFNGLRRTRFLNLSHNLLVFLNSDRKQNFFQLFRYLGHLEELDLSHNLLNLSGGGYSGQLPFS